MRSRILLGLLAAATVSFALGEKAPAPHAPLWFVHIDHVNRKAAADFDAVTKRDADIRRSIYVGHSMNPPPSWKIVTADGVWYTFRGRDSLAEIEKPSTVPAAIQKEIAEKTEETEKLFHAALDSHHSEIWSLDDDSVYTPVAPFSPASVRMTFDELIPGREDGHNDFDKRLYEALAKTDSPVGLISFYSQYGDGRIVYVWFGPNRALLDAWRPDSVLNKAFGGVEAKRVMTEWHESTGATSTVDGTYRADVSTAGPPFAH